jgi:hypothetical protein
MACGETGGGRRIGAVVAVSICGGLIADVVPVGLTAKILAFAGIQAEFVYAALSQLVCMKCGERR